MTGLSLRINYILFTKGHSSQISYFCTVIGWNGTFVSERTWQLQTEFIPPLWISKRFDGGGVEERETAKEASAAGRGKDCDDEEFASGMKWQDESLTGNHRDDRSQVWHEMCGGEVVFALFHFSFHSVNGIVFKRLLLECFDFLWRVTRGDGRCETETQNKESWGRRRARRKQELWFTKRVKGSGLSEEAENDSLQSTWHGEMEQEWKTAVTVS